MRPLTRLKQDNLIRPNPTVRKATNKILEMIDECLLDPKDIALMCLKWMSEDDVKEMCKANEINLEEDEEDDAD